MQLCVHVEMLMIEIVAFVWTAKMIVTKNSLHKNNAVYLVYKINLCFNSKRCLCRQGLKPNQAQSLFFDSSADNLELIKDFTCKFMWKF